MSYQRGVRPDYTVGTITLVSNSKNFTTVGASLKTATIGSGDTIMTADGRVLIISEITGQNAGVLAYPCPASAAGANLPLRIRFQPSSSGVQGAVRDLLERWGITGNVDALSALVGYLNAVPVFTGAGTMMLVNLDDIGIDDPHGNLAQLAALAKAANHFVIMGADGSVTLKPISELTDVIENNKLAIADHAADIASLQTGKFDKPTGAIGQFLRGNGTPQSVVGTVTQADGGSIVQRGNNANGEFVRFADGTQICWGKTEVIHSNSNSNTGRLGGDWAYPAAFSTSNNEVFMNIPIQQAANWTGITGAQSGRGSARAGGAASSATGATLSIFFDSGTVSTTEGRVQNISLMAIGRWS